ncbi:hypothetical protein LY474_29785 [Myxococcus stipitatus]|uniref:hypothetical protein n=1 Tax=Myxococcus stipitatus TaxID=83455 RepID=UPI001F24BBF4|nr:hypothetical protein [Myxococcus stipitatus]MCE9672005.1 hypothetical protein [Myxococcus stipitatus]
MEHDRPILTHKEKGTLLKVFLGILAFKWVSAELFVIGAVGVLALIIAIGVIASLATWLLKYSLIALGIYVVFVLTLRWLHGDKKSRPPEEGLADLDALEAATKGRSQEQLELDAQLTLARFKAEHAEELARSKKP